MFEIADARFDTLVVDKEERPIALVEVDTQPAGPNRMAFLPKAMEALGKPVRFLLAVDPISIRIYEWNGREHNDLVELNTVEVLQRYEPEFGSRRIFKDYFVTIVEGWLRDLAYHWKSKDPPGAEELRRVGLLDQLEGGTTVTLGKMKSWA